MGTIPILPKVLEPFKNHQYFHDFAWKAGRLFESKAIFEHQKWNSHTHEDYCDYGKDDNRDPLRHLCLAYALPIWFRLVPWHPLEQFRYHWVLHPLALLQPILPDCRHHVDRRLWWRAAAYKQRQQWPEAFPVHNNPGHPRILLHVGWPHSLSEKPSSHLWLWLANWW